MGEVIPMLHVCRDCNPASLCVECEWYGKLLDREFTAQEINRPEEEVK